MIRRTKTDVAMAMMKYPKARRRLARQKLLKSPCNARNSFEMDPEKLVVKDMPGPTPFSSAAYPEPHRGRMYRINKRTSHITIVVAERE